MRTRSLRLRVIVGVLGALAVVLLGAGVLVERVLAAQLRGDLEQRLVDRVGYGQLLASEGLTGDDLADTLRSPADGIQVVFYGSDGTTSVGVPTAPAGPGAGPADGGPAVGPRQTAEPHAPAEVARDVTVSSGDDGITASIEVTGGRLVATGSTYDISQTLQRLRTIELVAGAGTLVVVGLLLTRVVSVALRPLSRMTDLARGIARGGRGGRLRPDNSRSELGRTAAAFDEMLTALESAERDAQTAARTAAAAEERMRRLLADVSHELRTPVASLQARAETLLRDNPPRERREDLALGMVRDTRRAARLVDDLLLMDRLERAPAEQLQHAPVELGHVVRAAVEQTGGSTAEVRVAVHAPHDVVVTGDAERLGQVLTNLLTNARRAVAGGGDVDVVVDAAGERAVVEVRDTGAGVAPADRDRIFDRFVRLDAARSRSDGGSGLGLPISRALARAHGGELVSADSPRGARFVLTLPLRPPPAVPALVPAGR